MYYSTATKITPAGLDELVAAEPAWLRGVGLFCIAAGGGVVVLGALVWLVIPVKGLMLAVYAIVDFLVVVMGGVLVLVGLLFAGRRRIVLDRRERRVRLSRAQGHLPREIAFDDLEAVELRPAAQADVAGKIDLVLSRPAGGRLGVAMRHGEEELQKDAARLAEFAGVGVRDTRLAEVPLEAGGRTMLVARHYHPDRPAPAARMGQLTRPSPEVIEITAHSALRPLRRALLVALWLFAAGAAALPIWAAISWVDMASLGLVFGLVPLVMGSAIAWEARAILFIPPIRLDRKEGQVSSPGLRVGDRSVGRIPLEQVAAVQVASGLVFVNDGPAYTSYQVNLVLTDPPGARLTLLVLRGRDRGFAAAGEVSEFLGVPLLDHTGADGATSPRD